MKVGEFERKMQAANYALAMKRIKIALTGLGGYGDYYANFLLNHIDNAKAEFVAVIDPFAKKANAYDAVTKKELPIYDTMEEFYSNNTADLMIISTPIQLHKQQCKTAVENGSTVLCEKPTTALLSDAMEMENAAKVAGKEVFIGFQLSFDDGILELKKDILSGMFGKPISAKAIVLWERDFAYYNRGIGWAGKIRNANGDAIYDSVASNATAHYLHNMLFLLGDSMDTAAMPDKIEARSMRANKIESFDTCVLNTTLLNGTDVRFVASHATKGTIDPKFSMAFENASLFFDSQVSEILTATFNNGETKEYSISISGDKYHKVTRIIDYLGGYTNDVPPFNIKTTMPFLTVTNFLFEKVRCTEFNKEDIVLDEVNQRVYVETLYDKLVDFYETGKFW